MRRFAIYWALVAAYLDPGSGSMIIQGVVALAVTVPFMLRSGIRRAISRVLGRDRSSRDRSSRDRSSRDRTPRP